MPRSEKGPIKEKRRPPNTGSVFVRKDGRITVTLPADLDPKRRRIYGPGNRQPFASAEEATAWLDAEIRRRRQPPATASPDELLGSYLARWYRLHEDEWPERTRVAYEVSLRRWRGIGHVPIKGLTREVVQGAVADLRRATWQRVRKDGTKSEPKRYSARTIAHAVSILHQALEDLIPDVLAHNPARLRRRGRAEQADEQPVWSAEEVAAFLAAADEHEPRFALGFRLILRRALRVGEVVALKIADVDAQAMTLTIDETAGIRRGEAGPTKTRRARDVPLSAELLAQIQAHRRAYPTTDPHLFTYEGRPLWIEYFRASWRKVVRRAGVPPIGPKDGRATCATALLDEGWPLPVVANLLGHTSVATTARFYQRVVTRRADQTAQLGERLDATLDGAGTPRAAQKSG